MMIDTKQIQWIEENFPLPACSRCGYCAAEDGGGPAWCRIHDDLLPDVGGRRLMEDVDGLPPGFTGADEISANCPEYLHESPVHSRLWDARGEGAAMNIARPEQRKTIIVEKWGSRIGFETRQICSAREWPAEKRCKSYDPGKYPNPVGFDCRHCDDGQTDLCDIQHGEN